MNLKDFKHQTIHLIGLSGAEGSSLALFFIRQGVKNLIGHDFCRPGDFSKNYFKYHQFQSREKSQQQIKQIKAAFKINFKKSYLQGLGRNDLIFAPSSWFRYAENKKLAKHQFFNWYNLVGEIFRGKIIGVTGTAGKGTTTHLITLMLKAAGKKVYLAGDAWQMTNLGKISSMPKNSWLVLELSNRTLTFASKTRFSPQLAVITNISKHHIDDHHNSFGEYIKTKKEIARYQTKVDYFLYNSADAEAGKLKRYGRAKHLAFSQTTAKKLWLNNRFLIGQHLRADAAAAIKVAKILKIRDVQIKKALATFRPRSGRMEPVGALNGIFFVNDGASTRPSASAAAIGAFSKNKVHLLLEGSRKKPHRSYYLDLLKIIRDCRVKNVFISGSITGFLLPLLKKTGVPAFASNGLAESVCRAYRSAKSGEIILLSPANESFGQFSDYRERVALFNATVKKLK